MKSSNILTVHKYKYRAEKARKILKKMSKKGLVKFCGIYNKEFVYETDNSGREEFFKRMKQK